MGNTIIKFWSNGCGNCKAIAPILEQVAAEHPDIAFESVNTADAEELVEKYGITTLPTLVFLKGGVEVGKMMGLKPKTLIVKKIQEVFGN
jgi:thioredoxin 1